MDTQTPNLVTKTCADCSLTFSYPPRRGRPAKWCPECKAKRVEAAGGEQGAVSYPSPSILSSYYVGVRLPSGSECQCVRGSKINTKGCGRFFSSDSAFDRHLAPLESPMACWDVTEMVNKWGKMVFKKVERSRGDVWMLRGYDKEGNEVEWDWGKKEEGEG